MRLNTTPAGTDGHWIKSAGQTIAINFKNHLVVFLTARNLAILVNHLEFLVDSLYYPFKEFWKQDVGSSDFH